MDGHQPETHGNRQIDIHRRNIQDRGPFQLVGIDHEDTQVTDISIDYSHQYIDDARDDLTDFLGKELRDQIDTDMHLELVCSGRPDKHTPDECRSSNLFYPEQSTIEHIPEYHVENDYPNGDG